MQHAMLESTSVTYHIKSQHLASSDSLNEVVYRLIQMSPLLSLYNIIYGIFQSSQRVKSGISNVKGTVA